MAGKQTPQPRFYTVYTQTETCDKKGTHEFPTGEANWGVTGVPNESEVQMLPFLPKLIECIAQPVE
jgi:hypothetical protein